MALAITVLNLIVGTKPRWKVNDDVLIRKGVLINK